METANEGGIGKSCRNDMQLASVTASPQEALLVPLLLLPPPLLLFFLPRELVRRRRQLERLALLQIDHRPVFSRQDFLKLVLVAVRALGGTGLGGVDGVEEGFGFSGDAGAAGQLRDEKG